MLSLLVGLVTAVATIASIEIFGRKRQHILLALLLAGIGFLYVGFTWMDHVQLAITAVQAILFLLIALQGIRNVSVLSIGYFLHGSWDIVYNYFITAENIPADYDIFCATIDFIICAYILIYSKRLLKTV